MKANLFDRDNMRYEPLSIRKNKVQIEQDAIDPATATAHVTDEQYHQIEQIVRSICRARRSGASVMLSFGAHTIKNGLALLLRTLILDGWVTHLATNGAGVIHDWEFSYLGSSSEDVRENVAQGRFGTWEETGLLINLALAVGAYEGLGYGSSVGSLISNNGLHIPERSALHRVCDHDSSASLQEKAAALDLLQVIDHLDIPSGFMAKEHRYAQYSVQSCAYEEGVPFTSHPMFGHDIIYTHKACSGAAIGRTSERDFLSFVDSVDHLQGGVYLSVGSAVMSPMVFEKSLSMARNVAKATGRAISDCDIHVVDLQPSTWDWRQGEPPQDNPAYYLRYMKTFNRMGCRANYHCMDNRDFFICLVEQLKKQGM